MKPNPNQELSLQQYLRRNLKYRETYAEFYDHILAAAEAKPNDVSFEEISNEIIIADFGGIDGMRIIENKYQRSTFNEMKKKYMEAIAECLKFPLIGILLTYSAIIIYLVKQPWFNVGVFLVLMLVLRLIPGAIKLIRYIRSGFVFADTKRSVKDAFFNWIDYIPGVILCIMLCGTDIFRSTPPLLLKDPVFNAFFLILCGWHAFAFYKVYNYDLKVSFNIN